MTVTNEKYKDLVVTNGVTVEFPFTFKTTNPDWVQCFLAEVAGEAPVEVTNFTVSLYPDQEVQEGGTVTFSVAPPSGTVAIVRGVDLTQTLNYTPYGPFPSESHEKGMDKLTYQQQLTNGERSRVLQYGYVTDFDVPVEVVVEKFEAINQFLYWKADGSIGSADLEVYGFATHAYVDAGDQVLQDQLDLLGPRVLQNEQDIDDLGIITQDHESRIGQNETTIQDHETRIGNNETAITGKAEASVEIISSDIDAVEVQGPTLADNVTLNVKTNAPSALSKLDQFGLVPLEHLPPTGGLRIIGLWDASTGDNPSDTRPDLEPYASGDTYVISVAGSIPLIDPVTGLYVSTSVIEGDLIIYVVDYNLVIVGWNKGSNVDSGTVAAANVSYVPYQGVTETDAQAAVQGLEDRTAKLAGGNNLTGRQSSAGNIVLANVIALLGRNAADDGDLSIAKVTATDGLEVGDSLANIDLKSLDTLQMLIGGVVKAVLNSAKLLVTGDVDVTGQYLINGAPVPTPPTPFAYVTGAGSNANGSYRTWSDGYKEQWFTSNSGIVINWTFPITFGNAASVSIGATPVSVLGVSMTAPSTSGVTIYPENTSVVYAFANGY